MQYGNINASVCSNNKTRKIIQWQFWQNWYHKLGRLVCAITLYLLQMSGPMLHLGDGLWLAKLIERRKKQTIGWNVLAAERSKFGSEFLPLCSALSSSVPPTLCHPTCISLLVSSSLLILHLHPASSCTPLLPSCTIQSEQLHSPLNLLTIRQRGLLPLMRCS